MKKMTLVASAAAVTFLVASASIVQAQSALMSAEWVEEMCAAWNAEPELTQNLDGWIENDEERGYKLMRIYRRDCPESPWVQMKIAKNGDGVVCVESSWASDEELTGADYVMFAETSRWLEMGEGLYGPMKGMMTGRLKFQGPKFEAMRNMGPFSNFLLLVGKVPGAVDVCPEIVAEVPMAETDMPKNLEEGMPGESDEGDLEEPEDDVSPELEDQGGADDPGR